MKEFLNDEAFRKTVTELKDKNEYFNQLFDKIPGETEVYATYSDESAVYNLPITYKGKNANLHLESYLGESSGIISQSINGELEAFFDFSGDKIEWATGDDIKTDFMNPDLCYFNVDYITPCPCVSHIDASICQCTAGLPSVTTIYIALPCSSGGGGGPYVDRTNSENDNISYPIEEIEFNRDHIVLPNVNLSQEDKDWLNNEDDDNLDLWVEFGEFLEGDKTNEDRHKLITKFIKAKRNGSNKSFQDYESLFNEMNSLVEEEDSWEIDDSFDSNDAISFASVAELADFLNNPVPEANDSSTATDEFGISDVSSNAYGFTLAFGWEQSEWSEEENQSTAMADDYNVDFVGELHYNLFIDGIGTVMTQNRHFRAVIDKRDGSVIERLEANN